MVRMIDDFYLSDYADGIAEIENECRGEFVYGISMRIFFGAFAAVFAVISIMTFIHTFNMKTFEDSGSESGHIVIISPDSSERNEVTE